MHEQIELLSEENVLFILLRTELLLIVQVYSIPVPIYSSTTLLPSPLFSYTNNSSFIWTFFLLLFE